MPEQQQSVIIFNFKYNFLSTMGKNLSIKYVKQIIIITLHGKEKVTSHTKTHLGDVVRHCNDDNYQRKGGALTDTQFFIIITMIIAINLTC